MRAVVYARISEDHERAESVPTQIANGTKYAERMGWDVVRVFKYEGRSGYTGEIRPGFEEMIEFLRGGQADVLIARHHDRLTRNPDDFARLMQVCGKAKIKISLYTGGELDLSTASGGFYGFMETGRSRYESAIRSQRVKDAVERNARAGKRTGGGSRPVGYKINRHDLGEGGKRRYRIIGEEIEPAEAEAIKEAATRVLRGESIRSIAFDFNDRGIKPVAGGRWAGSTLRRMLVSPRIAGLREHSGEVVGDAAWPAIIDRAIHDRLVGLLDDPSRRRENFRRPRVHPLVGLVYCASCGGKMTTAIAPRQGRGYACRKDENPICPARTRIVAEPLEAYVEGHVMFTYSQTEGDEIPMPEVPEWSLDRALDTLDLKRVPYAMLSANASGYSYGRSLAISPMDESPMVTALHESGHILHGHTEPERMKEYLHHRGLYDLTFIRLAGCWVECGVG